MATAKYTIVGDYIEVTGNLSALGRAQAGDVEHIGRDEWTTHGESANWVLPGPWSGRYRRPIKNCSPEILQAAGYHVESMHFL